MRSKKVKKRKTAKKVVTVTSTTEFKYTPDNFDIFLLNALKEKIGRSEASIIQLALSNLYADLFHPNWSPPNYIPGMIFPDVNTPTWETGITITCDGTTDYKYSVDNIPGVKSRYCETILLT